MGIHVDPAFNQNRRLYTCQGHQSGDAHDIRIVPWVVSSDGQRLVRRPAIVTGIPATGGSHGGCRLRFGARPVALDRHRRRDDRHQPPGPHEPRRQDPAGEPVHRRRRRGQPVLVERERQHAAGAELRPPQRAGHRAAAPTARCGPSSTAPAGTTRSTGASAATSAGIRCPGYNEGRPMTDLDEVPERGRGGLVVGRADAGHVRRRLAHRLAVGHLGGPPRGGHAEGRIAAHLRGVAERHEAHAGGDPVQGPLRPAPRRCRWAPTVRSTSRPRTGTRQDRILQVAPGLSRSGAEHLEQLVGRDHLELVERAARRGRGRAATRSRRALWRKRPESTRS